MIARCFSAMALTAALALAPVMASAQSLQGPPAPPKTGYKPVRDAYGHPSLEGVWTSATVTRLERNPRDGKSLVMTDAEANKIEGKVKAQVDLGNKPTDPKATVVDLPADCSGGRGTNCNYNAAWTDPGTVVMRVNGQPRNGFITSTADGRVPMRKDVKGVGQFGQRLLPAGMSPSDNPEGRALGERCLLSFGNSAGPVMLPLLYNNNYQIAQNKDSVAIWVEMVHDVRRIDIGRTQHLPSNIRPWFGDSIGHYEGDTLVVETTNYPRQNAFRGAWEDLKVTEKFTRVAKDRVLYQFKVEAPSVWDAAWGGEYEFGAAKGMVYEYACHEGNYALEGMLAGARAEDAAAAQKRAAN